MRESIYSVTGSVERSVAPNDSEISYPLYSASMLPVVRTSSLQLQRSVRHSREDQSNLHDRFLLGKAYNSEIGQAGTQNAFAVPPTMTHSTLGVNHAFVAQALSASRPEEQLLNCWNSGSEVLESSAVSATSSVFYSKRTSYSTVTYKYLTSASDSLFSASYGAEVSGSVHTVYAPRKFTLNVNETGRLVDIRVWIEVTNLSQSFGAGNNVPFEPLSDLGISIRSPNLRWGHAHPIQNDPSYRVQWPTGSVDFWDSSFVLWEGWSIAGMFGVLPGGTPSGFMTRDLSPDANDAAFHLATWGKDRNMRTIFVDGSPIPNPRHLLGDERLSSRVNGAPCSSSLLASPAPTPFGNDVPWMSDSSVAGSGSAYSAVGSPPRGWLSGPGGAALADEWPTTGVNYGAETIRPLYPMLDSIYGIKSERTAGPFTILSPDPVQGWEKWRGFRPGLRSTEISGTWEIMFAKQNVYFQGSGDPPGYLSMKTFVRQMRIELTYEKNFKPRSVSDGESRGSTVNAHNPGPRFLFKISGSQGKNAGSSLYDAPIFNKVQIWTAVSEKNGIGRTFGLVTKTGSLVEGEFSLFYRLSGALADRIGESPHWLISNEFGVPMIPESTSSLVSSTSNVLSTPAPVKSPMNVINPTRDVSHVVGPAAFVRRTNQPKKLSEIAREFASSRIAETSVPSNGPYVYVCDGTEGTEFFINLPVPRQDDKYVVFGSFDGGISTTIEFPRISTGDRTRERFKVVLGASPSSGDRIAFTIDGFVKEI